MMNHDYNGSENGLSPEQELHELEVFCSECFEDLDGEYTEIEVVRRSSFLFTEQ